jgi:Flp pilus assembly protein TadD
LQPLQWPLWSKTVRFDDKPDYEQTGDQPPQAQTYISLGSLALQCEDNAQALRWFSLACRCDSTAAKAHSGLAMTHQQMGNHAEAFKAYMRCLEIDGDDMLALLGLFQTSCKMGTFRQIIRYLEVFLDKHPDDSAVTFCLATLYARDGQFLQARGSVMKVLASEPGKSEARHLLQQIDRRLAVAGMGGA